MIELPNVKTEADAKREAKRISTETGKYVIVVSCFGAFATVHDRLNVFAPSDTCYGWYAHRGQIRHFTDAQKVADQNATPTTR